MPVIHEPIVGEANINTRDNTEQRRPVSPPTQKSSKPDNTNRSFAESSASQGVRSSERAPINEIKLDSRTSRSQSAQTILSASQASLHVIDSNSSSNTAYAHNGFGHLPNESHLNIGTSLQEPQNGVDESYLANDMPTDMIDLSKMKFTTPPTALNRDSNDLLIDLSALPQHNSSVVSNLQSPKLDSGAAGRQLQNCLPLFLKLTFCDSNFKIYFLSYFKYICLLN